MAKAMGKMVAVLIVVLCVLCVPASVRANTVTSGELSTNTAGQVITTDGWTGGHNGFEISWSVTPGGSSGGYQIWDYKYDISGKAFGKDDVLSTAADAFILQVSPNFHASDIIGAVTLNGNTLPSTNWTVAIWDDSNAPAGWPTTQVVTGIGFDLGGLTTAQIAFATEHSPVPGSFFAAGTGAYAYNTGLTGVSGVDTIGVPDGRVLVPEPSLAILAMIGLVGGALGRRASRKKKED